MCWGGGGRGGAKDRIGYPTQKPVALLERMIEASSNPGDIVCDPLFLRHNISLTI